VIAIVFASAMMGVTIPAIEDAAAFNSEKQVDQELATIEEAANSLLYNEDVPAPGTPAPTRQITVSFPKDSLTSTSISEVKFDRDWDAPVTHVTYYVDGRSVGQYVIDAPLVMRNSKTFSVEGNTDIELQLSLGRDRDGSKAIIVQRHSEIVNTDRIVVTDVSTNGPISADETLETTATLRNPTENSYRLTVEFDLSTTDVIREKVTLGPGSTVRKTVEFNETRHYAGTHTLTVRSDTSQQTTVEIR